MRKYQFFAFLILGIPIFIPFSHETVGQQAEPKKKHSSFPHYNSLPQWFKDLDDDEVGGISREQWRTAGKDLREFSKYDLDGDGVLTAEELFSYLRKRLELKLLKARAEVGIRLEEWTDEKYRGKRAFLIFTVHLEEGKKYQIDHVSGEMDPYLFLEDSDGTLLAENDDGGEGLNARIVYRPNKTGSYQIIATSQSSRPGGFGLSVRVNNYFGLVAPKGLPWWFNDLDKDADFQISLNEWGEGGRKLGEFHQYDLNNDGLITAEEFLNYLDKPFELNLKADRLKYHGTVEETPDQLYRGKKSYKVLTLKAKAGKTYQIDHQSNFFQAFLHLEDSAGNLLLENSSPDVGSNSRLIFHAEKSGTYYIIATSAGGYRTGDFDLTLRYAHTAPKGLPAWFNELDKDEDDQISLQEWQAGNRKLADFQRYDLNDDGLITSDELLRYLSRPIELNLKAENLTYHGTVEETPEQIYRGKKSYKVLTMNVIAGKSYQIDHTSKAFQAFLHLEDSSGNLLQENCSPDVGGNSRLIFQAAETGTYYIIATSAGGYRTGDFELTVRYTRILPKGVPAWFNEVDKDGDEQISLHEWTNAGREFGEFHKYDLNNDGIVTADEIFRYLKKKEIRPPEPPADG